MRRNSAKSFFAPKSLANARGDDAKSAFLSFCHRIPNAAAHVLLPPPQHNSGRGAHLSRPHSGKAVAVGRKSGQQLRNYTLHGGHTEVWLRVPGIGACSAVSGRFAFAPDICAPRCGGARGVFRLGFAPQQIQSPKAPETLKNSFRANGSGHSAVPSSTPKQANLLRLHSFAPLRTLNGKRIRAAAIARFRRKTNRRVYFYAPARKGLSCGEPFLSVFTEKPFIRPLQVNCPKSNRCFHKK